MNPYYRHITVLQKEVVDYAPKSTQTILDCTLGGGGHSHSLLEKYSKAFLYGIDRDSIAVKASERRLQNFSKQTRLIHASFSELNAFSDKWDNPSFDYIIADIGVSSEQLSCPERGFSFIHEGPLDMRMDPKRQNITAEKIVNNANEHELVNILRNFGEERYARKIVSTILAERRKKDFRTTLELAGLVNNVIPNKMKKKGFNPATKTFQALRIAVNNELQELISLLEQAPKLLKNSGRLAVISFHSLEDRMIKQQFRKWENPCVCTTDLPYCVCGEIPLGKVITRRRVKASKEELAKNPRSRSASLRVFAKTTR
tara:strand:+ start:825 stop:1769 length:945 start_codon:yes stop_codon:yes gene_type:complete